MAEIEQWVVLELGPKAEGEDPDTVRASIRHSIRDAEVFIPASVIQIGEDKVVQYLVEGYAFIRRDHPDQTYFRLENTKYVQTVLRKSANGPTGRPIRQLAFVTGDHIERFRGQLRVEVDQGIGVGDTVLITSGAYRQIEARVEEEILERDAVQVYIKLRSKEALITLPRGCLRLVSKAPRLPHQDKITVLRTWLHAARSVAAWSKDGVARVLLPYATVSRLEQWLSDGRLRFNFIHSFDVRLELDTLRDRYEYLATLSGWLQTAKPLHDVVRGFYMPLELAPLQVKGAEVERLHQGHRLYSLFSGLYQPIPSHSLLKSKYDEWQRLQVLSQRLEALSTYLEDLEHSLQKGSSMIQNVIVDGTQLAIRCAEAPGLGALKDSKGNPTGAVMGFLRSLGSYRKRFPGAALYVCWDGSSQRRRKMFAGYKANRSVRVPISFEINWLRANLPLLGVHQAFHEEEEADDVIATLVRGPLKGQMNAFVSTDRDLVQLVTDTDHQFVPAVGMGKEKLYDVAAVEREYGVPPPEVVFVRSLDGDTSDNIPGAPGIGLKTASKLVKLYGSIDRLFASNLAGLTKAQLSNLRAAEKQVKLNVELMKLCDDLSVTIAAPNPDQISVSHRLKEIDIQPDNIVAALL